MTTCESCGIPIEKPRHGIRKFCIPCSQSKNRLTGNMYYGAWMDSHGPDILRFKDDIPVLINVYPNNWGFNPAYEEEGL